jgi:hypothetical protein
VTTLEVDELDFGVRKTSVAARARVLVAVAQKLATAHDDDTVAGLLRDKALLDALAILDVQRGYVAEDDVAAVRLARHERRQAVIRKSLISLLVPRGSLGRLLEGLRLRNDHWLVKLRNAVDEDLYKGLSA